MRTSHFQKYNKYSNTFLLQTTLQCLSTLGDLIYRKEGNVCTIKLNLVLPKVFAGKNFHGTNFCGWVVRRLEVHGVYFSD